MARVDADTACPIFASPEGCRLEANMQIGTFGQGTGITIPVDADGNTAGLLAVYPELKTGDAVLTALTVQAGLYSRFLVNKAQTNDVSLFGAELQMCVKANLGNGVHAGAWCYWEQSGTVTCSVGVDCALAAAVKGAATLTATNLFGIHIDSKMAAATITNFAAIHVASSGAKPYDYIVDVGSGGAPVVGVMRLTAVANVVVSSGGLTKTEAGYLIVYIGTSKRYIPLYSA